MFRPLSVLFLGLAMISPFAATAQDRHDQQSQQQTKRYYDKAGKDYHEWNQNEDRKYHDYLAEKHMKNRDFAQQSSRQQTLYFTWSHQHEGRH